MTVREIAKTLALQPAITPMIEKSLDAEITDAYTGDLLSDVMGNAPDKCLFITIQAHKNTVAVASLKDSPAIIICNDRNIPQDMIEAAKNESIMIFRTKKNQYTISGTLFSLIKTP